ncbi:MAG: hypothetical protein SFW62_02800 [Alphaproteobacteria bacterium]|nr:hypothetical protein [Alphaproteobacteria bacterium]
MAYDFPCQDSTNSDFPPEVVCSTDRRILADWRNSAYEMYVWRRPQFDAKPFMDYIASLPPPYLKAVNMLTLRVTLGRKRSLLFELDSARDKEIEILGIKTTSLDMKQIIVGNEGRLLANDIETRLREDLPFIFPRQKEFKIRFRTQTFEPDIGWHVDSDPVIGYNYGPGGTEYVSWQAVREADSSYRKVPDRYVDKSQVRYLQPGDLSIGKNILHRPLTSESAFNRLWVGASLPAFIYS